MIAHEDTSYFYSREHPRVLSETFLLSTGSTYNLTKGVAFINSRIEVLTGQIGKKSVKRKYIILEEMFLWYHTHSDAGSNIQSHNTELSTNRDLIGLELLRILEKKYN